MLTFYARSKIHIQVRTILTNFAGTFINGQFILKDKIKMWYHGNSVSRTVFFCIFCTQKCIVLKCKLQISQQSEGWKNLQPNIERNIANPLDSADNSITEEVWHVF